MNLEVQVLVDSESSRRRLRSTSSRLTVPSLTTEEDHHMEQFTTHCEMHPASTVLSVDLKLTSSAFFYLNYFYYVLRLLLYPNGPVVYAMLCYKLKTRIE